MGQGGHRHVQHKAEKDRDRDLHQVRSEDDPFENYFQAVIWLVFELLGRYVRCEVRQARGRADVVVEATAHVYVMELKRDGTAMEALAQIDEHGYAAPFAADSRQLHLIGCAFDSRTRLLADWLER